MGNDEDRIALKQMQEAYLQFVFFLLPFGQDAFGRKFYRTKMNDKMNKKPCEKGPCDTLFVHKKVKSRTFVEQGWCYDGSISDSGMVWTVMKQ